ncbi:MAG TPA: hypothetical protein VGE18_01075 [Candidatus Paceibacterota bacterium]
MTTKEFFTGRAIVLSALLIIGAGILAYSTFTPAAPSVEEEPVQTQEEARKGPATFAWKFEKADTDNLDGLPNTNVFVEATYADGAIVQKLVDTTPGSCNATPEKEKDSAPGTARIVCYAAGLGYYFKIVKGESSYVVMRKMFEEGSPEYEPPEQEYEAIAEFPFSE